jgi:hypothetical protein
MTVPKSHLSRLKGLFRSSPQVCNEIQLFTSNLRGKKRSQPIHIVLTTIFSQIPTPTSVSRPQLISFSGPPCYSASASFSTSAISSRFGIPPAANATTAPSGSSRNKRLRLAPRRTLLSSILVGRSPHDDPFRPHRRTYSDCTRGKVASPRLASKSCLSQSRHIATATAAGTYVSYGMTQKLFEACSAQADYQIPQAAKKGEDVPKTAGGEDLGVGSGWWYEGLSFAILSLF